MSATNKEKCITLPIKTLPSQFRTTMVCHGPLLGSKSVLSEHKYYSIAKDCYLGKHSGV